MRGVRVLGDGVSGLPIVEFVVILVTEFQRRIDLLTLIGKNVSFDTAYGRESVSAGGNLCSLLS